MNTFQPPDFDMSEHFNLTQELEKEIDNNMHDVINLTQDLENVTNEFEEPALTQQLKEIMGEHI